jgi:REP element-mobilizing transposase RayT
MSRVAGNEWLLGEDEKEVFRKMMWQVADFSGIEIMSYCIMSNHFHILLRVPDDSGIKISDEELIRRYQVLYPEPHPLLEHSHEELKEILVKDGQEASEVRDWLLSRMHYLPAFMKCLKQRFSIWYNKKHDRFGTFWAERFKSLLVEASDEAIQIVSAYIDLNPVRAGIVNDPKDYRFCNYAEAVAANSAAAGGLMSVMGTSEFANALSRYRLYLFEKGYDPDLLESDKIAISPEQVEDVRLSDGHLTIQELLRCKTRYFSDGMILGSQEFVDEIFEENREFFGPNRKDGARKIKGGDFGSLFSARFLG